MTTREQEAIEIAAKAAFDAFYAEGTPYTDIERAMFKQVASAVYDALLAAGVIPAEGTVFSDAQLDAIRLACAILRAKTEDAMASRSNRDIVHAYDNARTILRTMIGDVPPGPPDPPLVPGRPKEIS